MCFILENFIDLYRKRNLIFGEFINNFDRKQLFFLVDLFIMCKLARPKNRPYFSIVSVGKWIQYDKRY